MNIPVSVIITSEPGGGKLSPWSKELLNGESTRGFVSVKFIPKAFCKIPMTYPSFDKELRFDTLQ